MTIEVRGDSGGKAVDWWFIYKLPGRIKPLKDAADEFKATTGLEYLYFDAKSKGAMKLSKHTLDEDGGALHQTLEQLYGAKAATKKSLGWICYNDEIPENKHSDDERNGHTKGVLAFDLESDTAFWLLHSWPKFPNIDAPELASAQYGQTFLCIALQDVDTARLIAEQMYHQQEPQTYDCCLPPAIKKDDIFSKLATSVDVNVSGSYSTADASTVGPGPTPPT